MRDTYQYRQFGLYVRGEYVARLGMVTVCCERQGGMVVPVSCAIPDQIEFPDEDDAA